MKNNTGKTDVHMRNNASDTNIGIINDVKNIDVNVANDQGNINAKMENVDIGNNQNIDPILSMVTDLNMNNLIIRPMRKTDINEVHEVEVDCFADPWSKKSLMDELKNNLARYLVADLNGKIVGYIGIWLIVDEGHITNVAVHSDYRGQRIGDRLVHEMVELCKKENIYSMTLEVRKSNIVAQNLYRKYGFKMAGIRKEYYSDNKEDAIIMWNQLKEF